jgi:hypothetical protein
LRPSLDADLQARSERTEVNEKDYIEQSYASWERSESRDKPELPIHWYSQQELDDRVAEAKKYSFWIGAGVWSLLLVGLSIVVPIIVRAIFK